MVLNYLWVGFILVGFLVALIRLLGYYFRDLFADKLGIIFDKADLDVFSAMVDSTFTSAATSVEIAIYLIGVMALWLGIMKIGEQGGAVHALGRVVNPFFRRLFPEVPDNHPAMGSMLMNFSANMLGLDNAATPLGLKAMHELQSLNRKKDTASNAQIMFLVLNTSGLTIVPISIMAIRAAQGAANPADVFVPLIIVTFASTMVGMIAVALKQRINLLSRVVLAYILGSILLVTGFVFYLQQLTQEEMAAQSRIIGHFILIMVIVSFLILGLRRKINLYESFIDGAKDGFKVAISIIPYLVAMLFAIGIFRASGAMEMITGSIGRLVAALGLNTDFVPALPTAFMKPLSGSGARGMMVEAIQNFGVDHFVARLSSIFQGSTETTFYTLAVYYGAVNVKKTRYTVGYGLLADFAGIISAIFVAYLIFH
ncbi:MAG: nucleoside recognition domain-containing protein [Bacteroidota bacterium]